MDTIGFKPNGDKRIGGSPVSVEAIKEAVSDFVASDQKNVSDLLSGLREAGVPIPKISVPKPPSERRGQPKER